MIKDSEIKKEAKEKFGNGKYLTDKEDGFRQGAEWALEQVKQMTMKEHLLIALKEFSQKYQFSFQFWGEGNNNVFIMKDFVELYSSGDHETIEDAMKDALDYVYRINRTPLKNRVK